MKKIVLLVIAVATVSFANPVIAADVIDASATFTSKADGSSFDYSLELFNSSSSTASIGTFWFGWVPGEDFLDVSPTNITTPSGWKETVTHGGTTDGYAIQFVAETGTPLLAPGSSLSGFGFTSTESPTELEGNSNFYPTTPQLTSFAYAGTPFTEPQDQFVVAAAAVSAVPEPSTLVLGLFAVVTSFGYVRLKKGKQTASR
jgi:hypothetical protein